MTKIPIRHITKTKTAPAAAGRFTIRDVRDLLNGKDVIHDLHRHDYFFILVLQKGKGIHEIDFTPYSIHDNTVFFLRPGQVHRLELKKGSTGYLVEFDPGFYRPEERSDKQRLRKVSHKNFCRTDAGRFKKLLAILAAVYDEYQNREDDYEAAIRASLALFFIGLARQSSNPKKLTAGAAPYAQERLEAFQELLEKQIATHKQVSDYAAFMHLSAFQLNNITRSTVGKTASELINEHILLEAKRHLLATPAQVKDIAWALGYEDVSYFIRFFRKHTGYSPEAFRKNSG